MKDDVLKRAIVVPIIVSFAWIIVGFPHSNPAYGSGRLFTREGFFVILLFFPVIGAVIAAIIGIIVAII